MPEQDQRRRQMEHSKKVFSVTFISREQTSEVLQPGKKPLDLRAPLVSLQPTFILGRVFSIPTMWGDELNAVESQLSVEVVRVVSVIGD
jgi:hypothetical protein